MNDYRSMLKALLTAIDEADTPGDRCVVCKTGTADHERRCAYERASQVIEKEEQGAFGKIERLVAGVMELGELDDLALLEAIGPLHDFVATEEFRFVHKQVISRDWWKAFTKRHGPALLEENEVVSAGLKQLHADRRATKA